MAEVTGTHELQDRESCRHDSTRTDGALDERCLRCGADGYWLDGVLFAKLRAHPGGKILIEPGHRTDKHEIDG